MNEERTSSISLFRNLPALFKVSWLLLLAGLLGITAGYALRIAGPGWAGITLFLTGYTFGLWPLVRSRTSAEPGGLYVAGLVMSTVTATFFLAIQLVMAGLLGSLFLMLGRFEGGAAFRILHIIGIMTAATVVIALPRAVRIVGAKRN